MAAEAAVGVQTLRYYERRGLLAEPARSASGYRSWPPDAVRVVRFVKRAQDLGFTLADIEELLHLAEGGPEQCDVVREMAQRRLADLEQRLADLVAMQRALTHLAGMCERPRGERECPLLHALGPAAEQLKTRQR